MIIYKSTYFIKLIVRTDCKTDFLWAFSNVFLAFRLYFTSWKKTENTTKYVNFNINTYYASIDNIDSIDTFWHRYTGEQN